MVEVLITRTFEKVFRKLDRKVQGKVIEHLGILANNPMIGKLLKGYYSIRVEDQLLRVKLRSLRVDDYRVIYWYDVLRNRVILLLIGHRKQVYKLLRRL